MVCAVLSFYAALGGGVYVLVTVGPSSFLMPSALAFALIAIRKVRVHLYIDPVHHIPQIVPFHIRSLPQVHPFLMPSALAWALIAIRKVRVRLSINLIHKQMLSTKIPFNR
jgi:hypothetical protein